MKQKNPIILQLERERESGRGEVESGYTFRKNVFFFLFLLFFLSTLQTNQTFNVNIKKNINKQTKNILKMIDMQKQLIRIKLCN